MSSNGEAEFMFHRGFCALLLAGGAAGGQLNFSPAVLTAGSRATQVTIVNSGGHLDNSEHFYWRGPRDSGFTFLSGTFNSCDSDGENCASFTAQITQLMLIFAG